MHNCKSALPLLLFLFLPISLLFAQDEPFVHWGSRPGSCYGLRKVWNPEWFQGQRKVNSYFEGWYFKVVGENSKIRYAFIPGISLGGDMHSFIQVINGSDGTTHYFRFPIDSFSFSPKRFAIQIGSNFFSVDSFYVDLKSEAISLKARMINSSLTSFPVKTLSPGIMGWYRFVPFMECFHGVVSIKHSVNGQLVVNMDTLCIKNGDGYIEKDWGRSMPSAWIWSQSNSFKHNPGTSFMLSVANIPWLGGAFTGFLGYLSVDDQLYRFATYTGAKLKEISTNGDTVRVTIKERKFRIQFEGSRQRSGKLLAPVNGDMHRNIHESIDATIIIKLFDKKNNLIYQDTARSAGLELVGEIQKLF